MSIAQTTRLEALISARKGHDKALALIEEALLIGALSIAEAQHERNRAAEEWRRAKFINQNPESLAFEGLDVQDLSPPPVSSAATNAISVGDGQSGDDTLRLVPYKRPGSPTLKGTSGREKRQSMFATGNAKVGSPSRTGGKGVGKVGRRLALLGAGGKENVMCIKQDEQHRQLGGEDFIPILVPPATIWPGANSFAAFDSERRGATHAQVHDIWSGSRFHLQVKEEMSIEQLNHMVRAHARVAPPLRQRVLHRGTPLQEGKGHTVGDYRLARGTTLHLEVGLMLGGPTKPFVGASVLLPAPR